MSKRLPALLLSLLISACAEKPLPEVVIRVVTTPVKQEDVTIYGEHVGLIEASERVEVNPRVDGFLEDISFVGV
jgi:multidrug efflux pump subunit AcrA (membrane-fusion protein)